MRELSVMLLCSDMVQMACYAPLFTNDNDRRFVLHAFAPSGIVIYEWQEKVQFTPLSYS